MVSVITCEEHIFNKEIIFQVFLQSLKFSVVGEQYFRETVKGPSP